MVTNFAATPISTHLPLRGFLSHGGTPKSSMFIGFSLINHPAIGDLLLVETRSEVRVSVAVQRASPSRRCKRKVHTLEPPPLWGTRRKPVTPVFGMVGVFEWFEVAPCELNFGIVFGCCIPVVSIFRIQNECFHNPHVRIQETWAVVGYVVHCLGYWLLEATNVRRVWWRITTMWLRLASLKGKPIPSPTVVPLLQNGSYGFRGEIQPALPGFNHGIL